MNLWLIPPLTLAALAAALYPVSYTHLDVYKRQLLTRIVID